MASVSTYLNFNGQTEEAFTFYKTVFGTEFDGNGIMRMGDVPPSEEDGPLAVVREASAAYVAAIAAFLAVDLEVARLVLVMINGVLVQRLLDHGRTPLTGQHALLVRLLINKPGSPA